MVAAIGLSELRQSIKELRNNDKYRHHKNTLHSLETALPIAISIMIILIAIPSHTSIGYYQLINEDEYEDFTWIHDHIDDYRDSNHTYDRGAVHPFKASPFSAITGIYIVSSSMHPTYGLSLHTKMEEFLNNKCTDTSFLDAYKIGLIYGNCNNSNLTMIHPKVYIYPGLYEK